MWIDHLLSDVPPAGPRRRQLKRTEIKRKGNFQRLGKLRSRPKPRTRNEDTAAFFFHEDTVRYGCAWCNAYPDSKHLAADPWDLLLLDSHHLIPKQVLKREGLQRCLYDARNALCLCRHHHARHENAVERVPAELIPERAVRFAREVGLLHVLERTYGLERRAA